LIWSLAVATVLSSAAVTAGDSAKGETVFNRCGQCHNAVKGGGNGLGPNLFGVVGRKAASLPNFPYSPALKNSKIIWTEVMLKKWVAGPKNLVPDTRMAFPGLRSSQEINDVVAYLRTRK
jgi:cytochrome c